MSTKTVEIEEKLGRCLRQRLAGATEIRDLQRLPAGATQETWAFAAVFGDDSRRLILRRRHSPLPESGGMEQCSLEVEAKLLEVVRRQGVRVPRVELALTPEDELGSGYVMEFIEGETIPRKILRDEIFASARPKLARQCGEVLAKIHSVDTARLPDLERRSPVEQLQQQLRSLDDLGRPNPVIELAIRWLDEHQPPSRRPCLVHGDFRNGNLIVGPEGLRAILDWELAKVGNPVEDIGWICANVWRFGKLEQRVGGFGSLEDLLLGYASAGGESVDPEEVRWWEALASLKWALGCMGMHRVFASGLDRTVERAAIGRRVSENEIDLLNLLAPRA